MQRINGIIIIVHYKANLDAKIASLENASGADAEKEYESTINGFKKLSSALQYNADTAIAFFDHEDRRPDETLCRQVM